MLSRDLCTWSKIPDDLILEGMWFIQIKDKPSNTYKFNDDSNFDIYILDVSVPLDSVSYDKTNFGKLVFKERVFPSSISISFRDSIKKPYINEFNSWLSTIYNFENNCIKKGWKKEGKIINLTQINIKQNKNTEKLLSNNVGGVGAIYSALNDLYHIDLNDVKIQKIMEYELDNCFISKIEDLEFNTDGSGPKEFSIELECEKCTPTYYTGGTTYIS